MEVAYETTYHQAEDRHWWSRARRDYFLRLIKALALPCNAAILDLGCASGALIEALLRQGYARAAGIDASNRAVQQSRLRGLENVHLMDAAAPSFPDSSIDLLIASDVLEHIRNEGDALARWHRLLKPGGTLAIFVPAFHFLWSAHDEANMHFRRYTRRQLEVRLAEAGFEVIFGSYWNFALFAPTVASRRIDRHVFKRKASSDGSLRVIPVINEILFALVRVENRALLAGIPLPVGVSAMVLARRPGGSC